MADNILIKSDSKFSLYDVSSNLPFWGALSRGYKYVFLLETNLLPDHSRYQTLYWLGVSDIDMVETNISSTSVSYMNSDNLHVLKRYR